MRLHRAPAVTALLLAATLTLAACSDDQPREPEPSPTSSGTTAAPTPSPSAEPTEPVLPEAAKEPTEAGARAFITYYFELINYAQATGDVGALIRRSASTCAACRNLAQRIGDQYAGGGRIDGGRNHTSVADADKVAPANQSAFGFRIRLNVRHEAQSVVDGNGSVDDRRAGANAFTAYLMWVNGNRWRLDVLEVD